MGEKIQVDLVSILDSPCVILEDLYLSAWDSVSVTRGRCTPSVLQGDQLRLGEVHTG